MKSPQKSPKTGEKVLAPVHANAGLEVAYRRKLTALIDEMARSVEYWIKAAYRANEPELARDESPAEAMRRAIRKLTRRWLSRFGTAAQELADYFATAVSERSDAALKAILKRGGFSVEWKMTRAQNDVVQAVVNENVALIKSIPQQCLGQVEGIVMRSVQTGRDLGQLTKDLQEQFGVTKRRAAFIARDQNNKATANLVRARQIEVGITTAQWLHSHAGRKPRPTHVAMHGKEYDVVEGMYDSAEKRFVFPGELCNCRCVSKSIVKGFS